MSDGPLVEARGVALTYEPTPTWLRWLIRSAINERVEALKGVNLELFPGQICGVIGPNGAGKSTLFRVFAGLLHPTAGTATVLGMDVATSTTRMRQHIGFMPADDRTLFLRYSCLENLRFHARMHGLDATDVSRRIEDVIALVELSDARDRAAVALSSGMRYRLMLARALLHRPRVLILDEPTGPLDPMTARQFIETLKTIVADHEIGVLLSSHRMDDIEALPDRVLLLDEGEVVYDGTVARLRSSHASPVLQLTASSASRAAELANILLRYPDVQDVGVHEDQLQVSTAASVGPLLARLGGAAIDIVDASRQPVPLRDVMARIIDDRRVQGGG